MISENQFNRINDKFLKVLTPFYKEINEIMITIVIKEH